MFMARAGSAVGSSKRNGCRPWLALPMYIWEGGVLRTGVCVQMCALRCRKWLCAGGYWIVRKPFPGSVVGAHGLLLGRACRVFMKCWLSVGTRPSRVGWQLLVPRCGLASRPTKGGWVQLR